MLAVSKVASSLGLQNWSGNVESIKGSIRGVHGGHFFFLRLMNEVQKEWKFWEWKIILWSLAMVHRENLGIFGRVP